MSKFEVRKYGQINLTYAKVKAPFLIVLKFREIAKLSLNDATKQHKDLTNFPVFRSIANCKICLIWAYLRISCTIVISMIVYSFTS